MAPDQNYQSTGTFDGISLASFLQLLEQERKSCVIAVRHGKMNGRLYFSDGDMVDAEYDDVSGLDAAYAILGWESPTFQIFHPEERIVRIKQPLTRLLLTASTQHDENRAAPAEKGTSTAGKPVTQQYQQTPLLARITQRISEIPGIKQYYLLNKQGKVIVRSSNKAKIGDFIAYCMVNGQQVQDAMGAKGLHNIRVRLPDDNMLLIIPSRNITFGFLVSQSASLTDIYQKLRQALAQKQ